MLISGSAIIMSPPIVHKSAQSHALLITKITRLAVKIKQLMHV